MKKTFTATLAAAIAAAALTLSASAAYNPDKAISFAKNNVYNSSMGKCAQYVSEVLKAGGVTNAYDISCSQLVKELNKSGEGSFVKLTMNSNGSIPYSANKNKIAKGSVIFYHCANETDGKPYVHTAVYSGEQTNDMLKFYARNSVKNNQVLYYKTCAYCGSKNITAYAFRFTDKAASQQGSAAASDKLSLQSVISSRSSIQCYNIKKRTITDIYYDKALTQRDNGAEIWRSDKCTILSINGDKSLQVKYPAGNGYKTRWVPVSSFFGSTTCEKGQLKYNTAVYNDNTLSGAKFGTAYTSDDVIIVGSKTSSAVQIIYNLDNGGYKSGFISRSALK